MTREPGLFDGDARLRELSAKGDDLERVNGLVDFACTYGGELHLCPQFRVNGMMVLGGHRGAGMTPEQMIAAASASGSPALKALVVGHLAAGRLGMAALALYLSRDALSALDAALIEMKDRAAAMGLLTVLVACGES